MLARLRSDQETAIDRLRESLRTGHRRPMLQAPTGYGKTKVAASVIDQAAGKGKRVAFVVPAISLVDQTVKELWNEGIMDVGVIQAQHDMTNWSRPIQVCSVQTLMRHKPPQADLVMIDEAHRWFEFYGKWMLSPEWLHIPFIGLSATPWTRGLGRYYDDLIIASTTKREIEQGHLSPFKVYAPSHPDLNGVRTLAGDYHEGDLAKAMEKHMLVADIVGTWVKHAKDQPTICFAVDRAHAKLLQQQFQRSGISADYIDANTSLQDREMIKARFHGRICKVVCSVGCLTTGIDWDVRCILLARPTKSEILFVQMIGRGLRTAEGKDHCLILDHSDTHLRMGFVTDIHHDELDQGRERLRSGTSRLPLPKECPSCAFLKPPRTAACPSCGFVCVAHSKIEPQKGDLVEFKGKAPEPSMADKMRFLGELQWIASERGYKPGWASNQYRHKFGVWPVSKNTAMPQRPSEATLRWVKSRFIAYAKGRKQRWAET